MSLKIIKGNISPATVRERAIQLAVIDGRPEDVMNQHDLDRAESELRDHESRGVARHGLPRELSDIPLAGDPTPSSGSQVASRPFDGDDNTSDLQSPFASLPLYNGT